MKLELISLISETLGTLMIAFAALKVHHRVLNEHKMDDRVFTSMRKEQRVGVIGVVLILLGFVIELFQLVT
jgi:hypothetical protein